MGRLGRVVVLGILVVGLLFGSAQTVPGTLDNSDPRPAPNANCQYSFEALKLTVDPSERDTTPYSELNATVRAVFDRRLARDNATVAVDQSTWLELDAVLNVSKYVVYKGTVYLIDARYSGCERWRAEYTGRT